MHVVQPLPGPYHPCALRSNCARSFCVRGGHAEFRGTFPLLIERSHSSLKEAFCVETTELEASGTSCTTAVNAKMIKACMNVVLAATLDSYV